MAFLLPVNDYDSIRSLLGLGETDLSDAVIEALPHLPSAEVQVKARAADHATIQAAAGDDWTLLRSAICYLTAAKLCGWAANRFREGDRVGDFTAGKMDWEALRAELQNGYEAAIGSVSTQTAPTVTLLTLAGVSRTIKARRQSDEGTLDEDLDFENI